MNENRSFDDELMKAARTLETDVAPERDLWPDIENAITTPSRSGATSVSSVHAVYGYSHDETGEMLGIATGTSKAQLHRAKRLLAQQLKQNGFES